MHAAYVFSDWYVLVSSELSGLSRGGLSDVRKTEAVSQRGGKAKAVAQAAGFELGAALPCPLTSRGAGSPGL